MPRSIVRALLALLIATVVLTLPTVVLATPFNLVPANGAGVSASAQSFSWQDDLAAGPIDHWYMEVSTSPETDYYYGGYFQSLPVATAGDLKVASVDLNALGRALAPGTYYWHVVGFYGWLGSNGVYWSGVQSFVVRSATPAAPPAIGVSPSSLTFDVEYNDPTWAAASLSVSNIGWGTLSFSMVFPAVNWIGHGGNTNTGIVFTQEVGVRPFSDVCTPPTTPLPPGTYTQNIEVRDNGSIPAASNGPVLVPVTMHVWPADDAAPGGASVVIDGGAAATNATTATLALAASDSGSGVGEMRLRDAGAAWSEWMPFSAQKSWRFGTGDAVKTVEAQFRDRVGNESPTASDSIVLDSTRPITVAPASARVVRGRTATLKYKVSDAAPNAGAATATIKIKTLRGKLVKTVPAGTKAVNVLQSVKFRCKLAKATYRFFVYAGDAAGNVQSRVGSNKLVVR
jgi:hypothetical protein